MADIPNFQTRLGLAAASRERMHEISVTLMPEQFEALRALYEHQGQLMTDVRRRCLYELDTISIARHVKFRDEVKYDIARMLAGIAGDLLSEFQVAVLEIALFDQVKGDLPAIEVPTT
jgi:hypothetical protein